MTTHLKNIAIVGAAGGIGTHITKSLLSLNKFNVTALTRPESEATFPPGVTVKKINYADVDSVVPALKGQDALIIALAFTTPQDVQHNIIDAAAAAGVPWVLPNEYGSDNGNPTMRDAVPLNGAKTQYIEKIEKLGKSSWIGLVCNPWYEFSLMHGNFGIDVKARTALLYDDGNQKISTTTMATCGEVVARLMALPVSAPAGEPSLSDYKNKYMYTSSFHVSQNDILASVQKATGTQAGDWKVTSRAVDEAIKGGHDKWNSGDFMGMIDILYGNVFKPGQGGEYETTKGTVNEKLGLPKDDLDVETRKAVEKILAQ